MTDPSIEHVAVTCTAELSAPSVDAGATLTITVTARCEPHCDLEGETIEIRDADGTAVATGTFGAYDEETDSNATEAIPVTTPIAAGQYGWSAFLTAYEDEEIAYGEVSVPVVFETRAHRTSVLVWDLPTAVTAGETFKVKIGVKCSSGCAQAHRPFTIVDHEGNEVVASAAGDATWPKSDALYFTELDLIAPGEVGLLRWEARSGEADLRADGMRDPVAHTAGAAGFDLRTVKRPDFKVRIEAWDGEKQVPLPGARVNLHPYGAVTDENGIAELEVAAGDYRVFVSRKKYTTFGTPVTIDGDLNRRIELYLEPPPDRE